MWYFGRERGTELLRKVGAAQNFAATNEALKQLYGILTVLDGKATGLLTVNAFFIAALLAFLAAPEQIAKFIGLIARPRVLELQLAALAISAFLCLLVVRVTWRFMRYVPDRPATAADFDDELRRLANVIDDRTRYYWFAWLFALIAFVLTLAWWFWWCALIGFVVVILWAWQRG